jgi:hypothetical protein
MEKQYQRNEGSRKGQAKRMTAEEDGALAGILEEEEVLRALLVPISGGGPGIENRNFYWKNKSHAQKTATKMKR